MKRGKRRGIAALGILAVLLCAVLLLRADSERSRRPIPAPPFFFGEQDAAEPTPLPDPLETLLSGMTPEEKVWQMFVLRPEQVTGEDSTADAALWTESLSRRPVGGLVFNGTNMESPEALKDMLAAAGGLSSRGVAPFLCVDEEGGTVARLAYYLGVTTDFKPMFTYREGGTETAYANARTIAEDVCGFGFNLDFAPVADVWTNPANTVIGKRAYSDDPTEAAALVAAAVQGFHDGGVMTVLKHFPGHGDTAEDSHLGAAYSDKTLEELEECEFLPFASGIAAGTDAVMMSHITLNAVAPGVPASLSRTVVTGLLREKLGFRDGVVITDAMEMSALAELDPCDAAVMAVEAGCDLLLAPPDPDAAAAAILARVPESRLDESVLRILRLKQARGLLVLE